MAKRRRRYGSPPEDHRSNARAISKSLRRDAAFARQTLIRAGKATGAKRQDLCAGALDYMMSASAAKAATYRERVGAGGKNLHRANISANRVTESLKDRFRKVCLLHPRSSRRGHW